MYQGCFGETPTFSVSYSSDCRPTLPTYECMISRQVGECDSQKSEGLFSFHAKDESKCKTRCMDEDDCNYYTYYNSKHNQIKQECLLYSTCEVGDCEENCFYGSMDCSKMRNSTEPTSPTPTARSTATTRGETSRPSTTAGTTEESTTSTTEIIKTDTESPKNTTKKPTTGTISTTEGDTTEPPITTKKTTTGTTVELTTTTTERDTTEPSTTTKTLTTGTSVTNFTKKISKFVKIAIHIDIIKGKFPKSCKFLKVENQNCQFLNSKSW